MTSDPILEQREEALAEANRIRSTRAAAKRSWKGTDRQVVKKSVAALIADPPSWAVTWELRKLITSVPGWGVSNCEKIITDLEIPPAVKLGDLKVLDRLALVECLTPDLVDVTGWNGETFLG